MSRTIHDSEAVASFHHLRGGLALGCACRGLACFAARADNPQRWAGACTQTPTVYCLGQCHVAPAIHEEEDRRPTARVAAPSSVLLANIIDGGTRDLNDYLARGGGRAIARARGMTPDALLDLITQSGLRGRGGAGFPAGRKWQAVRYSSGDPVIVANADEGDPGAFSDKALLEEDPFRLLEAIGIAAQAIGSHRAIIYLRCEYPKAARILADALTQAQNADWPGNVSITLITGEGGFVCGEETSLLNAIEGRRPFVRSRPPYPFQHGLNGRPTLVQNVETLCAVPWIVEHGAQAYRNLGSGDSAGTKLISLNSLFRKPGLVEVSFGITVRDIVEEIGEGLRRGRLMGVMIGGPLAGVIPPSGGALNTRFTYEGLHAIGCSVGHGGLIAFADDTSIAELISEVFRFGATESCGLCVPCHLGTSELARAFGKVSEGCVSIGRQRWDQLIMALEQTSVCGHGSGLAEFARSIERHYPQELAACLQ